MNDMALTFPPELLKRQAVIYVRQSTQSQVMTNLESQRRQYDLVEMARGFGFAGIDVIDDDLGVSASGCHVRPGFALSCSLYVNIPSLAYCDAVWGERHPPHFYFPIINFNPLKPTPAPVRLAARNTPALCAYLTAHRPWPSCQG